MERWRAGAYGAMVRDDGGPYVLYTEVQHRLDEQATEGGRVPSAWAEFGDGHDYSRTGKHDPNECRACLRHVLQKVEKSKLAARVVSAEAQAAISGDIVAILQSYQELKGCE